MIFFAVAVAAAATPLLFVFQCEPRAWESEQFVSHEWLFSFYSFSSLSCLVRVKTTTKTTKCNVKVPKAKSISMWFISHCIIKDKRWITMNGNQNSSQLHSALNNIHTSHTHIIVGVERQIYHFLVLRVIILSHLAQSDLFWSAFVNCYRRTYDFLSRRRGRVAWVFKIIIESETPELRLTIF